MSSQYCLLIHKLKLAMLIGVLEFEHNQLQDVEITLQVYYDYVPVAGEQSYVSYADIVTKIETETQKIGHIGLVEDYAAKIASWIFEDGRVTRVIIEVLKTAILPQTSGVGVRLDQSR